VFKRQLSILFLMTFIAGCATNIPEAIRSAPEGNPRVAEVRVDVDVFTGAEVRWGGEIASVENFESLTQIEIVARDLTSSGRPLDDDHSPGRFVANIQGFLDPAVYAEKRQISIFGVVTGSQSRPIGEYIYNYPTVEVRTHVLWQPLPERDPYYYPPYWYDPWYDPWYRHHYWRHPYRYH